MQFMDEFNNRLALKITRAVGSMWCAYAFAAIALVSLPAALGSGSLIVIVAWVAQTFLQLVLLSIIIVGQDLSGREQAAEIAQTRDAVLEELQLMRDDHTAMAELVQDLHAVHVEGRVPLEKRIVRD